jgi:hypothetical protein
MALRAFDAEQTHAYSPRRAARLNVDRIGVDDVQDDGGDRASARMLRTTGGQEERKNDET